VKGSWGTLRAILWGIEPALGSLQGSARLKSTCSLGSFGDWYPPDL